jgi:outer membrane lipoprotein-sorting protein
MMERFFSLPLRTQEALGVLIGKVPLCQGQDNRVYREGDYLLLETICQPDGRIQRIPLDPRTKEPVGFRIHDTSDQEVLVVTWRDFEREGDIRVPTEISVEMPTRGRMLRFRIEDLEINPSIPDERFRLRLPPRIDVQPLQS